MLSEHCLVKHLQRHQSIDHLWTPLSLMLQQSGSFKSEKQLLLFITYRSWLILKWSQQLNLLWWVCLMQWLSMVSFDQQVMLITGSAIILIRLWKTSSHFWDFQGRIIMLMVVNATVVSLVYSVSKTEMSPKLF